MLWCSRWGEFESAVRDMTVVKKLGVKTEGHDHRAKGQGPGCFEVLSMVW